MKVEGSSVENDGLKAEAETSSVSGNKSSEQSTIPCDASKQDYIHVRARRGQATDSHSLAERVTRFLFISCLFQVLLAIGHFSLIYKQMKVFLFLLFLFTICSQACHLTPPVFAGKKRKSQWENENSSGFGSRV